MRTRETRTLIEKWNGLHAGRTALGFASAAIRCASMSYPGCRFCIRITQARQSSLSPRNFSAAGKVTLDCRGAQTRFAAHTTSGHTLTVLA